MSSMSLKVLNDILKLLEKENVLLVRKSGPGTQSLIASYLLENSKSSVVVIFPDNSSLQDFASLLTIFCQQKEFSKWDRDWVIFSRFDTSILSWADIWVNLFNLKERKNKKIGVALTVDNLLPYLFPQKVVEKEYLFLSVGYEISPNSILEECLSWGYNRVELVTQIGEIALRGGVLDVFTSCYNYPLRIEFFGETIDSIRLFDPISQRSKKILEDALILPISPCVFKEEYFGEALKRWDYLWKTGYITKDTKYLLEKDLLDHKLITFPGIFYRDCEPLKNFLPEDSLFLLIGGDVLRKRLEESVEFWKDRLKKGLDGITLPFEVVFQMINQARETWIDKKQIVFDDLSEFYENPKLDLFEKRFYSYQDLIWTGNYTKRPYSSLVSSLKEWEKSHFQILLLFSNSKRRDRFLNFLEGSDLSIKTSYNPYEKSIFALVSDFDKGLELCWSDTLIISERILQLPSWKDKDKGLKDFKGLRKIEEIRPGDFVVHRDYGIGKFLGLTHLNINNLKNDFLEILYANEDRLFLPVDRLNLIQKFKAPDNIVPVLDKLGSNKWSITKEKVRKALQKIAYDLVKLYAYRKTGKGFSYPPADDLYKEFEATFGFEETPDQEKVISEVLKDMESSKPMDRLVCGDAGFGKTEVAMRAAFKAVCGGKQVMFLCPTTVLAEQHYQNFKKRMKDFPVTLAMLSRFVPKNEQKRIVEEAAKGKIDILIGTHRLLSKDVKLPRLGLLIIDEEQRFGVNQKEKIKKLKQNIDVLTLTATPIPRTLQLSLSGIRDLSIIETPPPERKAVKSFFITKDPVKLKEAVERELERGGQVFWVYNKIQGLKEVKEFVQSLVPDAKVAMAHGRMAEKTLEETMHKFWKGEIDVLVCTSIIESGLDFPNANTIIIDNAHMFGLGQLYQLRGRVGRSKKQGYAYFVVPNKKNLSSLAEKRLQTIMNLDFLGAGFYIAMEDLRIRGAGNILGEAQTGCISKVGLDMFLEILEKEIKKAKGEKLEEEIDPELNIYVPANIPENYISSHQERLSYYKALASCNSKDELEEVILEIKDRFGPLPKPLINLKKIFLLKQTLKRLRSHRADIYENKTIIWWDVKNFTIDISKFMQWADKNKKNLKLHPDSRVEFCYNKENFEKSLEDVIKNLKDLLILGKKVEKEVELC